MLILAFKLFLTPLLIVSVTLAGRRWGTAVSGLLIGLPLVSAPISFIRSLMPTYLLYKCSSKPVRSQGKSSH